MVAPCSISTACFSLGVFTCTVIFPLPWLERALEQATQNCQVGQHVVSNHNQKHLCSLRHGDAGSAGRLAALCNEINHLSNLQQTHVQLAPTLCCSISALINPEAAAANAASRLSTFWNLLGSRNLYTLHVIIGKQKYFYPAMVFGPIDIANLRNQFNRIRIIMGKFGCTQIRT